MDALLIYVVKSSGLLAAFFLIYYIFLRRDTFFTVSRFYLIGGLLLSMLLPLFTIEKKVFVKQSPHSFREIIALAQPVSGDVNGSVPPAEIEATNLPDFADMIWYLYISVAVVMLAGVLFNLYSLYRLLYKREVVKQHGLKLVDLDKDVAPFSFFSYIVFNSRLYSPGELNSILSHEIVHSKQKHTIDILLARFMCILFWFNPFVWLYKKAISQNLEFIADRQAIQTTLDRKAYQIALLKVGSTSNTFSITNPFYQSLIKKRIVMLNKEESKKRNLFKYALVLPLLAGFIFCFQVEVVAQSSDSVYTGIRERIYVNGGPLVISKNSSDADLKKQAAKLKEKGVTLKVSKLKRNSRGEITSIKVECKDKDGNKTVSHVSGKDPIKPIHLGAKSFGANNSKVHVFNLNDPAALKSLKSTADSETLAFFEDMEDQDFEDMEWDVEIIEDASAPPVPAVPVTPGDVNAPAPPSPPASPSTGRSKIILKKNGDKKVMILNNGKASGTAMGLAGSEPMIIVNGKILRPGSLQALNMHPELIDKMEVLKGDHAIKRYGAEAKDGVIVIDLKEIEQIKEGAIRQANEALNTAGKKMTESNIELTQAKIEMEKARQEMEKAKAEMEKAKAEYEKAKADLKKK